MTTAAIDNAAYKLENSLPLLTNEEITRLMGYAVARVRRPGDAPLPVWMLKVLGAEKVRRASDEPELSEPGMLEVPDWTPLETSQALKVATCLTYQDLQPAECKFADDLCCFIVALSCCMLEEYDRELGAKSDA